MFEGNDNSILLFVSSAGMILVAVAAVLFWRRRTSLPFRWFVFGAALWFVAMVIKFAIAEPANPVVITYLRHHLRYAEFLVVVGLYGGLLSSVTEIGLTWLAAILWRPLGRDPDRAIGIGIGAGAFESLWYGIAGPATALSVPLFWMVDPVERVIVLLCHASSRALVLLGVAHRRPMMVLAGFAIFTLMDGVATAAIVHGDLNTSLIWRVELAFLPLAIVSVLILRWCSVNFGGSPEARTIEPFSVSAC